MLKHSSVKMKPKSKKGSETDSLKALTTSMKPSKRRSTENQAKKSPVSVQMLNILEGKKDRQSERKESAAETKKGKITRQNALVKLTEAVEMTQVMF